MKSRKDRNKLTPSALERDEVAIIIQRFYNDFHKIKLTLNKERDKLCNEKIKTYSNDFTRYIYIFTFMVPSLYSSPESL